jgi:hypothetical protein
LEKPIDDLPPGVQRITLFGKHYTHFNMEDSMLDVQFVKTAQRIEEVYFDVFPSKQDRMRVQEWVTRLCDHWCCERLPLMKNRNRYVKLLLTCLTDLGRLAGIFKKLPPKNSQDITTLQKHQILEIEFEIRFQKT